MIEKTLRTLKANDYKGLKRLLLITDVALGAAVIGIGISNFVIPAVATINSVGQVGLYDKLFITMFGRMNAMQQAEAFLKLAGGSLIGGEIAAAILKNKTQKKTKLATGHLITKKDITDMLGDDGSILSEDIQLKEKYDFEGSVVFGSTGSGKTSSFFIPNLLNSNLKGSIIVNDPSGELYEKTSWFQKYICNRNVLKFAPLEPDYSEKYNLLSSCKDNDEVKEIASSLLFNGGLSIELSTGKKVQGAEWIQMSESLLSSVLIYSKDLGYPYDNIEFALMLILNLSTDQLDKLFNDSKNQDCISEWNAFKVIGGADRTEGSIKITLSSNMRIFTNKKISQINSISTFNLEDFRKKPTILYLTYPEHKSNYISPYTAVFLTKMLDTFIEEYTKDSLPVHCYFDEFCDLGMILGMTSKVRTVRKKKISFNICIQGLTQLIQIYGKENAMSILNNLNTKIIFPSMSDIQALDYISQLCGEKEIEIVSKSENKNGSSTSYSKTKVMMFNKAELRTLDKKQLLILMSNKNPILSTQNKYFENPEYKDKIQNPIEVKKQSVEIYDYKDYIEDLKIDLVIDKEQKYDIRKDIFR